VRIDSGDLSAHARSVRRILDDGALEATTIFASGNIDEHTSPRCWRPARRSTASVSAPRSAPRWTCPRSTRCTSCRPAPGGKRSEGKTHWPGAKRLAPVPPLVALRAWHAQQIAALPEPLRALEPAREPNPVHVTQRLRRLGAEADAQVLP
jgi:hypothetical protein